MSTNIWIFKYSNKMALEYYSYSCQLPSTNIFGYSFVHFWTTEYIQIFVHKFLKNEIYLNICLQTYSNKITLKYYLYLYFCYFQHTNIFGYSFGKYVASEYILIFVRYIMWHPNIFRYLFMSILWYSLITALYHHIEIIYLVRDKCQLFCLATEPCGMAFAVHEKLSDSA